MAAINPPTVLVTFLWVQLAVLVIQSSCAAPAVLSSVAPVPKTKGDLPVDMPSLLSLPRLDGSSKEGLPKFVNRQDGGLKPLIADVPDKGDLTDCPREPPPQITVPGFEDFSSSYRSGIVLLVGRDATGKAYFGCSGSLIHPKIVLTAGHCLYDLTNRKFNLNTTHSIEVYANANGFYDHDVFDSRYAQQAVIFNTFPTVVTPAQLFTGVDLGLLVLSAPFTNSYIFSWTTATSSTELRSLVGYPGLTQPGSLQVSDISTSATMRFGTSCAPGAPFTLTSAIICEDMQSEAGQSGAPLFRLYSGRIVGVLSGGVLAGCGTFFTPVGSTRFPMSVLLRNAGCSMSTFAGVSRVAACL